MGTVIKFGKAMLGAAIVIKAASYGDKLPETLKLGADKADPTKGLDLRPYVAGGAALFGLMMIPAAKKVATPA